MFIALYLCVASLATPCKFIVIATKTSPASVAEPVPTKTKKLFHWSGLYTAEATIKAMLTETNFLGLHGDTNKPFGAEPGWA